MEYTQFGKTGVEVSRIGFGGAPAGLKNYLGEYDPDLPENNKRIIEAIDTALEVDINYFDTAPGYGNGKSEVRANAKLCDDLSGRLDIKPLFTYY